MQKWLAALSASSLLVACGAPVVGGNNDAGMDVVMDTAPSCDGGQMICSGRCVDPQIDPNNCGTCGRSCAAGQTCRAGACEIVCPSGQSVCDGRCVSTAGDREHCGACGNVCPAGQVCSMGTCGATCAAGTTNCAGSCRDTQNDRLNCGACGTTCPSGQVCVMGACATSCPMGQTECLGQCVNTQSDRANCGACGTTCAAGQICNMGACELSCAAGQTACGTPAACTNLQTDRLNCGACGTACAAGQVCNMGACELSCAAGQTACGTPAACTNLQSDRANCGACGTACAAGLVCDMGMCVPSCSAGQTNCMGSCTSTVTDPNHCGACGNVCGPYANAVASCATSACIMTCNAGFNDCNSDRSDGCEVQVATDANNCGRCGNVCSFANGTGSCTAGGCRLTACNAGFDNCDGIDANGCECRRTTVGSMGIPFSDGTLSNARIDPVRGVVPDGMVTTSTDDYLWIVNTAESTVSKWDATTDPPTQLARYRVGISVGECNGSCCHTNGCNMASRVAIDGNGDVYVANRGFAMQGTVTKIAGSRANCVDRNGNGMIDTSTGPSNLLAYTNAIGQPVDECVLWTANVGPSNALLRAITVDRGDMSATGGYVWVGGYNNSTFYKVHPRTGETIATVAVPVRPYGAVVTADGRLWIGTLDEGATASIDTTAATPTVSARIAYPLALRGNCINSYGITADAAGRLWFAGWTCRDALGYAPGTGVGGAGGTWSRVDTTALITGYSGRGLTPGADGYIYLAGEDPSELNSRVVRWLASDHSMGSVPASRVTNVINPARQGPSGIGFDRRGRLYLTHWGAGVPLYRYDPMTMATITTAGVNQSYSYSDFTGSVRRTSIPEGSFTYVLNTTCANPRLAGLSLATMLPAGTTMTVSARSSATMAGLAGASDVPVATLPPNGSPYDLGAAFRAAAQTPAQFVRITINMRAAGDGSTPALSALNATWTCP